MVYDPSRLAQRMVDEERFRRDLYFRINVVNIKVPALRDRPDDIVALVQHFIERYSTSCRKQITGIRPAAMADLIHYEWPGNVRELQNVIYRAVIVAEHDMIEPEDFIGIRPGGSQSGTDPCFQHVRQFDAEFRRKLAYDALATCNGNTDSRGENLQISRAYLHRLVGGEADETSEDSQVA